MNDKPNQNAKILHDVAAIFQGWDTARKEGKFKNDRDGATKLIQEGLEAAGEILPLINEMVVQYYILDHDPTSGNLHNALYILRQRHASGKDEIRYQGDLAGELTGAEDCFLKDFVVLANELERWAEKTAAEKPQVGAGEIPDDTITLAIAVKDYMVSRSTLKRKIKNGDLKTYRPANAPKNGGHRVSRKEIETFFEPKR